MIIQFISDLHGQWAKVSLSKCDVLCISGDIFNMNIEHELFEFQTWLIKHHKAGFFDKAIIVPGNHDRILTIQAYCRRLDNYPNIYVYTNSTIVINNLRFGCYSWSELPFWAFYADPKFHGKMLDKLGPCDILVSHCPAHGVLDVGGSLNEHLGIKELSDYVTSHKPLIHAHGHIHEDYGAIKGVDTLSINSAVVNARNEFVVSRKPVLVEVYPETGIIDYEKSYVPIVNHKGYMFDD